MFSIFNIFKIKRKDLEEHLQQDIQEHFDLLAVKQIQTKSQLQEMESVLKETMSELQDRDDKLRETELRLEKNEVELKENIEDLSQNRNEHENLKCKFDQLEEKKR